MSDVEKCTLHNFILYPHLWTTFILLSLQPVRSQRGKLKFWANKVALNKLIETKLDLAGEWVAHWSLVGGNGRLGRGGCVFSKGRQGVEQGCKGDTRAQSIQAGFIAFPGSEQTKSPIPHGFRTVTSETLFVLQWTEKNYRRWPSTRILPVACLVYVFKLLTPSNTLYMFCLYN